MSTIIRVEHGGSASDDRCILVRDGIDAPSMTSLLNLSPRGGRYIRGYQSGIVSLGIEQGEPCAQLEPECNLWAQTAASLAIDKPTNGDKIMPHMFILQHQVVRKGFCLLIRTKRAVDKWGLIRSDGLILLEVTWKFKLLSGKICRPYLLRIIDAFDGSLDTTEKAVRSSAPMFAPDMGFILLTPNAYLTIYQSSFLGPPMSPKRGAPNRGRFQKGL